MPDPTIRLYSYAMSPFAAKVHCFLLFKQLDFECFYIDPLRVKRDLPVGHQIPVLTVGDESRADSTPIGLWLDELFPDRPLLPADAVERKRVLAIDEWVTQRLIPGSFRSYPGSGIDRFLGGWRLASVMARTARGGLPWALRAAWPLVIWGLSFTRTQRAMTDTHLSVREAKLVLYEEFVAQLEGGPYLGGRPSPSLPDLAAYPQFALYWATGFRGGQDVRVQPALMAWLERMRPWVSGAPPLLPAAVMERELP